MLEIDIINVTEIVEQFCHFGIMFFYIVAFKGTTSHAEINFTSLILMRLDATVWSMVEIGFVREEKFSIIDVDVELGAIIAESCWIMAT